MTNLLASFSNSSCFHNNIASGDYFCDISLEAKKSSFTTLLGLQLTTKLWRQILEIRCANLSSCFLGSKVVSSYCLVIVFPLQVSKNNSHSLRLKELSYEGILSRTYYRENKCTTSIIFMIVRFFLSHRTSLFLSFYTLN